MHGCNHYRGWVKPGSGSRRQVDKTGRPELGDHVIHINALRQFTFCYRYSNFEMEITILVTLC